MREHMKKIVLLSCLMLFSLTAYAGSCSDLMDSINQDINRYASSIKDKSLPWMQISWLQKKLGHANKKALASNKLFYLWKCPDNDSAFLKVLTDQDGKIIIVSGQYSSENGAGEFFARLKKSTPNLIKQTTAPLTTVTPPAQVTTPLSTVTPTLINPPPTLPLTSNTAQSYDLDQTSKENLSLYADHIRNCIPSTFKIPDTSIADALPFFTADKVDYQSLTDIIHKQGYVTYQIVGWDKNKCLVNSTNNLIFLPCDYLSSSENKNLEQLFKANNLCLVKTGTAMGTFSCTYSKDNLAALSQSAINHLTNKSDDADLARKIINATMSCRSLAKIDERYNQFE